MKHCVTLLLLSLLLWLYPRSAAAQRRGNVWTFGHEAALDFNSGNPTVLHPSALISVEGCAAICDASGSLLCYSDGHLVYDRTNNVMLNGKGILGNEYYSSTQGVGIFPVPQRQGLYYLFTLSSGEAAESWLRYSIIDMSLNSGLGAVTRSKNILIDSVISEKMVLSTDCTHPWLITHHKDKPIFYAYPLDSTIAMNAPVISTAGAGGPRKFAFGEMKISPAGNRLALANYFKGTSVFDIGTIELYDFDHTTGVVSGGGIIDTFQGIQIPYGVDFSPDGSKLYAGILNTGIYQYDLSLLPSLAAAQASRYTVYPEGPWGFRLGPDNMLYVIIADAGHQLSRIRNPDAKAALCDFEYNIGSLHFASDVGLGLGMRINEVPGYYRGDTLLLPSDTVLCMGDTLAIDLTTATASYLWQDSSRNPDKMLTRSGTYWAEVTTDGCTLSDTTRLLVKEAPGLSGADTTLCNGETRSLIISPDLGTYLWQDGSTSSRYEVSAPGTYSVRISYDGCLFTRSLDIRYKNCNSCVAIANAFTPNGDMLNDEFKIQYLCPVRQQSLSVYDRWGRQVFHSEGASQSWSGTINGTDAAPGTYFYLLKILLDTPGAEEELFKGDITLIR